MYRNDEDQSLLCPAPCTVGRLWVAPKVLEQLLRLCGDAAFLKQLLIVEPPIPRLLSLASAV